jgi:hypothetical protein
VERLKLYLRAPLRERERGRETVCLFVEFESEEIGVFYLFYRREWFITGQMRVW